MVTSAENDSEVKSRGRPRDPSVDAAILQTVRDQLGASGYSRMTVEAVAKAAGVTRPTVYLRWPSKEELVIAAISDLERPDQTPTSGDTKADLTTILREVQVSFFEHGNSRILGALYSERQHSPKLIAEFRSRLVAPRRDSIRRVLIDGIERGAVRPDLNVEAVVSALVGSMYAKLMVGDDVTDDFAEQVVDALWVGVEIP